MRESLRRTLLWQGIGFVLYLGGLILFVIVAQGVFFGPPANAMTFTGADLAVLLTGLLLIVVGRIVSWKGGEEATTLLGTVAAIREQRPEPSRLEELGYQVPPEGEQGDDMIYEGGEIYIRCDECGAKNEREFDYCANCSSPLPE